jgi:hypothetical protein
MEQSQYPVAEVFPHVADVSRDHMRALKQPCCLGCASRAIGRETFRLGVALISQ